MSEYSGHVEVSVILPGGEVMLDVGVADFVRTLAFAIHPEARTLGCCQGDPLDLEAERNNPASILIGSESKYWIASFSERVVAALGGTYPKAVRVEYKGRVGEFPLTVPAPENWMNIRVSWFEDGRGQWGPEVMFVLGIYWYPEERRIVEEAVNTVLENMAKNPASTIKFRRRSSRQQAEEGRRFESDHT